MPGFALDFLLALTPPTPAGTQTHPTAQLLQTVALLAFFMVIMYLLMIRPQQKKAREHQAMLKLLKPGDKVVTSGGVWGVVVTVKEKTVVLRSMDAKMEVLKSAVTEITERASS